MAEKMRKCAVCGQEYPVCRTCEDIKTFKPWRTITDTAEHYQIHLILTEYTNQHITKAEAKEMLKRCNVADYENFLPHIASVIKTILEDNNQEVAVAHDKYNQKHKKNKSKW